MFKFAFIGILTCTLASCRSASPNSQIATSVDPGRTTDDSVVFKIKFEKPSAPISELLMSEAKLRSKIQTEDFPTGCYEKIYITAGSKGLVYDVIQLYEDKKLEKEIEGSVYAPNGSYYKVEFHVYCQFDGSYNYTDRLTKLADGTIKVQSPGIFTVPTIEIKWLDVQTFKVDTPTGSYESSSGWTLSIPNSWSRGPRESSGNALVDIPLKVKSGIWLPQGTYHIVTKTGTTQDGNVAAFSKDVTL